MNNKSKWLFEAEVQNLTEGSLTRNIFTLALPTLGALLIRASFNLVDIFWVGKLGGEAIAALSVSGFVIWMLFSASRLAVNGATAFVSRRVGENNLKDASYMAWQSVSITILLAVFTGGFFLALEKQIFYFMKTPPEVTALGYQYLTIILLGLPAEFLFFTFAAILRGAGNARTPMVILSLSLFLNALLDPVLIFGWLGAPALGVGGAALATIISHAVGCVLFVLSLPEFMKKDLGRIESFLPNWQVYWRIIKIGAPLSISGVAFCFVYVFLTRITSQFGVAALAALGIGHRLESLAYFVHAAFGEATATLVGQNLGAGKPDRATSSVWWSGGYAAGIASLTTIAFLLIPEQLVSIFTNDPAIIKTSAAYLRIVAVGEIFSAFEVVCEGAFIGSGHTLPPMIISIILAYARIPIASVLCFKILGTVDGVWWAVGSTMILRGIITPAWFSLGYWKKKKI